MNEKRTWLRKLRIRRGLSGGEVAKAAGVSGATYYQIESGRVCRVETAKKVAEALNFPWEWMYDGPK